MSNEDILEQSSEGENSSIDIKQLLEAANSKAFDDEDDLLRKDKSFEKVSSFFDLIKASSTDEVVSREVQQVEQESDGTSGIDLVEKEVVPEDEGLSEQAADQDRNLEDAESNEDNSGDLTSQDEVTVSEVDSEKLESNEDQSVSQDDFQPIDVIEQSRETVEKLKSEDSEEASHSDEVSEEYNRGYQDALSEFEKTLQAEKKAISNFGNTLLSLRDDASKVIEELMKEKISEIARDFLGSQITEFPEKFLSHIENVSASIISNSSEIVIELNEIDAVALKTNTKLEELPFVVKEVAELGRGEFRMIVGKSGYEQRIDE